MQSNPRGTPLSLYLRSVPPGTVCRVLLGWACKHPRTSSSREPAVARVPASYSQQSYSQPPDNQQPNRREQGAESESGPDARRCSLLVSCSSWPASVERYSEFRSRTLAGHRRVSLRRPSARAPAAPRGECRPHSRVRHRARTNGSSQALSTSSLRVCPEVGNQEPRLGHVSRRSRRILRSPIVSGCLEPISA